MFGLCKTICTCNLLVQLALSSVAITKIQRSPILVAKLSFLKFNFFFIFSHIFPSRNRRWWYANICRIWYFMLTFKKKKKHEIKEKEMVTDQIILIIHFDMLIDYPKGYLCIKNQHFYIFSELFVFFFKFVPLKIHQKWLYSHILRHRKMKRTVKIKEPFMWKTITLDLFNRIDCENLELNRYQCYFGKMKIKIKNKTSPASSYL